MGGERIGLLCLCGSLALGAEAINDIGLSHPASARDSRPCGA